MGFFSSLKQNIDHGGVKVSMQVPQTISENDPSFTAVVTILNSGDTPQTVKQVKVSLIEDRSQPTAVNIGTSSSSNFGTSSSGNVRDEMSSASDDGLFVLNSAETKVVTLNIPLNMGKFSSNMLPNNEFVSAAARVLGGLQQVTDFMSNTNYSYYIQAVVDVDGISFDPSTEKQIQLLKPGQIGGGLHLSL